MASSRKKKSHHTEYAHGESFWGIDEVGVSCIAGPLVVVAYAPLPGQFVAGVRDSKRLSRERRVELFPKLVNSGAWGVVVVTPAAVDAMGPKGSIVRACELLLAHGFRPARMDGKPLDVPGANGYLKCIPHGDEHFYEIAAASVLAKVTSEIILDAMELVEPGFSFGQHCGYPTPQHLQELREHGPTLYHRRLYLRKMGYHYSGKHDGHTSLPLSLGLGERLGIIIQSRTGEDLRWQPILGTTTTGQSVLRGLEKLGVWTHAKPGEEQTL